MKFLLLLIIPIIAIYGFFLRRSYLAFTRDIDEYLSDLPENITNLPETKDNRFYSLLIRRNVTTQSQLISMLKGNKNSDGKEKTSIRVLDYLFLFFCILIILIYILFQIFLPNETDLNFLLLIGAMITIVAYINLHFFFKEINHRVEIFNDYLKRVSSF